MVPHVKRLSVAAILLIAGCGNGVETSTTTSFVTTTATSVTAPILPGNEIASVFNAGDVVGVIGVAEGDNLLLLSFPGDTGETILEVDSLETAVETLGVAWEIGSIPWELVLLGGREGYLPRANLAFVARSEEITAQFAGSTSDSPLELGEEIASEIEASRVVLVGRPDDLELIYDVLGFGDDSLAGYRVRVVLVESEQGFAATLVERSPLCARGLTEDSICL